MSATFAGLAADAAEAGHDRLGLARAYNMLWVAQTSLGVADAATWAHKALEMYSGQRRPRRRGERPEQPRDRGVLRRRLACRGGVLHGQPRSPPAGRRPRGGSAGGDQSRGGGVAAGAVRRGVRAVRVRAADLGDDRVPVGRRAHDGESGRGASAGGRTARRARHTRVGTVPLARTRRLGAATGDGRASDRVSAPRPPVRSCARRGGAAVRRVGRAPRRRRRVDHPTPPVARARASWPRAIAPPPR